MTQQITFLGRNINDMSKSELIDIITLIYRPDTDKEYRNMKEQVMRLPTLHPAPLKES